MGNRLFLSLSYFNIPPKVRKLLSLALIKDVVKNWPSSIVLINTESELEFETGTGKLPKEHPLYRYSSTVSGMDLPYLNREAFLILCNELGKLKNPNVFDRGITLVLQSKPPSNLSITAFDALCVVTPVDNAVIPLLYQTVSAMRSYARTLPIFLWIFGESKIEAGAEFFLQIRNELELLSKDSLELIYAGCVHLPPEELSLLLRFNVDIHTAFAESSILGEVRYASQRMFTFPEIQTGSLSGESLRALVP